MKVMIKSNTLGDTRTATRVPTFAEFVEANKSHREDVRSMMDGLAFIIQDRGKKHDITKIEEPNKSLFYRELCAKIEGKIDSFTEGEWYQIHCKAERHHLLKRCPDDVNLIDVIEMLCDCICAGMSRSGSVSPIELPSEMLQRAFQNTVKLCSDAVIIEKGSE